MTQQQQEEVNLLKELIADSSISADERMIYEDALSELMKSEKPKASTERKPKATTERKPRTTTQRKPQAPKQSKSDIESAKAEIKRRTGKTEEECESIVNEYRSLRAKSVERKKKETIASADNKDRVAKLKKDDKIISGTSEKTADAVIESTTKDVAEKIVKELDKIEQKAEVEATKEVKKEMPKESTTEQNKAIAEKTEEKVKEIVKTKTKRILIDTSDLLTSIAESLGRFDKDSQKEFLIKLRSDIDKLLTKFSYGGATMGATQTFNITQSNMSSSSVNPTMFGGGGGVDKFEVGENAHLSNGQKNKMYLDSLRMSYKQAILENISKSYGGISIEQVENEVYDNDAEMLYEYITNNDNLRKRVYGEQSTIYSNFKKGGKVNTGLSWHLDRAKFNKSEDYEIPLSSRKKKRFDEGGGVENGYMVFNYSDDYYATDNVFATKKEANNFIKEFRNRYKQQGYFRDNRMNKIAIEDIDLEIIPSDFNPFGKFNGGGGVDNKKRFLVDFYDSSDTNRDTSIEISIRANTLEDAIEDAIKKANEFQKNYIEFYHRNMFLGSINFAVSKEFREGKGYNDFVNNRFDNGGGVDGELKKGDKVYILENFSNNPYATPKKIRGIVVSYNNPNVNVKFDDGYSKTINQRFLYKEKYNNGGGVEMNDSPKRKFIGQMTDRESFAVNEGYDPDEEYFFDEDDYEEDSIGSNAG